MLTKQLSSAQTLYQRQAAIVAQRLAAAYPALWISGPRQSGKTTLSKAIFPHLPYVSLENSDTRLFATQDPRSFLEKYKNGAIFDEIQHTPELPSYLQEIIDNTTETGRFIITGSQNFAISQSVTQSLAGRVGMITLLPLSAAELKVDDPFAFLLSGGYPRLHQKMIAPDDFYPSYIETYIQRDVRSIKNIENLATFKRFLSLCAGRVGQLLNVSTLAADCNIGTTTAHNWLSVLEASYIIFLLRPYHTNFNKRLTKMPKLYFYDTGLAASLLEIDCKEKLDIHFARGSLFENLIILEVLKERYNRGLRPHLFFWRDSTGKEIDLLDDCKNITRAFEVKTSKTPHAEDTKNLEYVRGFIPHIRTYGVYGRSHIGTMHGHQLIGLDEIADILHEQ